MKTTENDLDQSLKNKINRLDDIVAYGRSSTVAFKNGAFVPQPIVDTMFAKKIFSDDNILDLKNHLYKSSENYSSAFDTPMATTPISTAPGLCVNVSTAPVFTIENDIVSIKTDGANFYVLSSTGIIYKISKKDPKQIVQISVFNILTAYYVSSGLSANDFTDICACDEYAIVSTDNYGIYKIFWDESKGHSKFSTELNVIKLDFVDNDKIVVFRNSTNESVVLIDRAAGQRIMAFSEMNYLGQALCDATVEDHNVYVLGRQYSPLMSPKMFHAYKLNNSKISYYCGDKEFADTPLADGFIPKFIRVLGSSIYLIGSKNNHLCVRMLSGEGNLKCFFDYDIAMVSAGYDEISCVNIDVDNVQIIAKNVLYVLNRVDMNIKNVYKIPDGNKISQGLFSDGELYLYQRNYCYSVVMPVSTNSNPIKLIVENPTLCNNIDIMIGMTEGTVSLINPEKNQEFKPVLHLQYGNYHVLKIVGSTLKEFIVRLDNPKNLTGFVVHYQ
jgi:hypothetical protein